MVPQEKYLTAWLLRENGEESQSRTEGKDTDYDVMRTLRRLQAPQVDTLC